MNAPDIQKFIDEQVEYCNNFIADPNEFINKMIQFMNEGKTHSELAKELNAQEGTVEFLVRTIEDSHKDLFKGLKNLSPEIVLNDFSKLNYNSFINKTKPSGMGIEIYPDNSSEWTWADTSFTVYHPVDDPTFAPAHLMSASSRCWDFFFRAPHKLYCSPETDEEKKEVIQMLLLVNKWLWQL